MPSIILIAKTCISIKISVSICDTLLSFILIYLNIYFTYGLLVSECLI